MLYGTCNKRTPHELTNKQGYPVYVLFARQNHRKWKLDRTKRAMAWAVVTKYLSYPLCEIILELGGMQFFAISFVYTSFSLFIVVAFPCQSSLSSFSSDLFDIFFSQRCVLSTSRIPQLSLYYPPAFKNYAQLLLKFPQYN